MTLRRDSDDGEDRGSDGPAGDRIRDALRRTHPLLVEILADLAPKAARHPGAA